MTLLSGRSTGVRKVGPVTMGVYYPRKPEVRGRSTGVMKDSSSFSLSRTLAPTFVLSLSLLLPHVHRRSKVFLEYSLRILVIDS